MHEVNIQIEPNTKYRRVIDGYHNPEDDDTDEAEWNDWPEEHNKAADAYLDTVHQAAEPTLSEMGVEAKNEPVLSWNDFGVANDPDLVAKMATYFEGMDADESTERLRAKLRLVDCDVYANAQIAARAELRGT